MTTIYKSDEGEIAIVHLAELNEYSARVHLRLGYRTPKDSPVWQYVTLAHQTAVRMSIKLQPTLYLPTFGLVRLAQANEIFAKHFGDNTKQAITQFVDFMRYDNRKEYGLEGEIALTRRAIASDEFFWSEPTFTDQDIIHLLNVENALMAKYLLFVSTVKKLKLTPSQSENLTLASNFRWTYTTYNTLGLQGHITPKLWSDVMRGSGNPYHTFVMRGEQMNQVHG